MIKRAFKVLRVDKMMSPVIPMMGWYFRRSPRMITCREFNEFIYDYVEDRLTESELKLFNRHMRLCPACRNFLKTYLAAYKAKDFVLPDDSESLPDSVPQDLITAINEVRKLKK